MKDKKFKYHRSSFISDTIELLIDMADRLGDLADDSINLGKRLEPIGGKKKTKEEKLFEDLDVDINAALDESEELLKRLGKLP